MNVRNTILFLALFLMGCTRNTREVNERKSFYLTDKNPYGLSVFKKIVSLNFPYTEVETVKKSFKTFIDGKNTFYDLKHENEVYIIISPMLSPSEEEASAMDDYVSKGNNLFIAADYFNEKFTDLFNLIQDTAFNVFDYFEGKIDTRTNLTDSVSLKKIDYWFFYNKLNKTIERTKNDSAEILGLNHNRIADFISFKHGKGRIFLMKNMVKLSNYFLLTGENYKYAKDALSYLPTAPSKVFISIHSGKESPSGDKGGIGQLLKIPALAWAFWLLLALLIIWLLTNMKRRQRIIEEIKPNTNSSVEFTETIARLYLNNKDNNNIAQKMIIYFNDHIRSHYYINSNTQQKDLAGILITKSGLDTETVNQLLFAIKQVQQTTDVADNQLLDLNNRMQQFFSKK